MFAVTGANPLLDVAVAIEQIALSDSYFIDRRLYPNVDFYSGLIYEAMGLPVDTYTVMFGVARMAGWVAQWLEMIADPEQKIARPRQLYVGPAVRSVPGGRLRQRQPVTRPARPSTRSSGSGGSSGRGRHWPIELAVLVHDRAAHADREHGAPQDLRPS